MKFKDRLVHAWNVFMNKDPTSYTDYGAGYSYRPDRPRMTRGTERTIVTSIVNRMAMDVAAIDIKHVRLNDQNRYIGDVNSGLNNCLTLEANIDQTGRAFIQDVAMSMFDEGAVAIVPVDTTINPVISDSYDIKTLRTAKVLEWYPASIRVEIYNDKIGRKEELTLPKKTVAIIENPLYAVMNEPSSTMQRLIRKLSLLDISDEAASSGKLDLILQLPYITKTQARKEQAEKRRQELEEQLSSGRLGIAYTDGTEKVIQLNRSLENNLLTQVEYLTNTLYSQLGITSAILDGTADEQTMLNYYNRTIEPVVSAICDEMKRKFLTKTARTQLQSIEYFREPFRLVPVNNIAEIADKFTRNEIMTSNEIRQIVGMKPSSDPNADELRNKNLNQSNEELNNTVSSVEGEEVDDDNERL